MKSVSSVFSTGIAKYDAIVVGAGYAGLITAAILAKNGLKTVVVEEIDQIGGRFGNTLWNGYWLDWGHRDAKDFFSDNFLVMTQTGQYGLKAAEAAGAEIALVGPISPNVRVHERSDKIVSWSAEPEAMIQFLMGILGLSASETEKFVTIQGGLAEQDPEKLMNVTLKEWLAANVEPELHKAFERNAKILFALPMEEISVGRWIHFLRNPTDIYKVNDLEVGGLQGVAEAYARVIRQHGGEIKLGLQTVEISVKDKKITGIVTRDRTQTVQEFRAPIVIFSHPVWDVIDALNKKYLPPELIENALKMKQAYTGGDLMGLNLGVSRLPTVRATGQPEHHMCWNQYTQLLPDGWYIPSLSSAKQAPDGKHLISILLCIDGIIDPLLESFEAGKARLQVVHEYIRQYYSDLDEITEWTSYQWYKIWPTASYWKPTPKSPLHLDGLEGFYFVGQTTEVDGSYQDVEANSALQVTQLILQRHKMHT